jgi:hypothetical protein
MRRSLFTIFLLLPVVVAYADLGSSYCVKGTIVTHNNKVFTGYFWMGGYDFSVTKGEDGQFSYSALGKTGRVKIVESENGSTLKVPETEKQFFLDAMQTLYHTIRVFPQATLIPFKAEFDLVPAYMGTPQVLKKENIKSLKIYTLQECSVLYDVSTPLTVTDAWVNGKVYEEEDLGQPSCHYFAFYYATPTASAKKLVKEFQKFVSGESSEEQVKDNEKKMAQLLQALKQHKVIIVYTCSC